MTRKLMVLNIALLAAIGFVVWQTRQRWLAEQAHEHAVLGKLVPLVAAPALPALAKAAPLSQSNYAAIAQQNLFTKDRNPNIIYDPPPPPPPPKPMPPLPVARGIMLWDGAPPTVVLSMKGNAAQRGYHPGDKIGEFTIKSVDQQYIVFDWEGKDVQKRLDELMEATPPEQEVARNTPAKAAAATPQQNLAATKNGQGAEMGGGYKACAPGDTQAAGAVVDGLKKVVSQTPFGSVCRWEPSK